MVLDGLSIDPSALEARLEEARARQRQERAFNDALLSPTQLQVRAQDAQQVLDGFNVVSLLAWLAIAERAGVAFIPARQLSVVRSDDLFNLLDNADLPEAIRALDQAVSGLEEGETFRFDSVAPAATKMAMSEGAAFHDGLARCGDRAYIEIDDPRFVDTLNNYNQSILPLLARPWVSALRTPGRDGASYPVEFRVFVEDDQVRGVSGYYPDAPLTDVEGVHGFVREALSQTEAMLEAMRMLRVVPRNGMLQPTFEVACTLDFLVREDGKVVFLEAGPRAGIAHPLNFATLPDFGNLEGLALAPEVVDPLPSSA